MFLALDTVFGQCSVAIVTSSGEVIHSDTMTGNREQTQQILPMIDKALMCSKIRLDQLSALIFNRGPGAFSGIRINTAVVQALSVAHDLPCVGISSLQVLAQAAHEQLGIESCYAVHDARMKQVYIGGFMLSDGLMQSMPKSVEIEAVSQTAPIVDEAFKAPMASTEPAEWLLDYDSQTLLTLPLVGDGASLLTAKANQPVYDELLLDGALLGRLGAAQFAGSGGVSAEQALPIYLRNNAWKTLKEQGKA